MIWFIRLLALLMPLAAALPAAAQIRIKDITDVEGVRENQLVGYGLVVGLNNTGDKLDNAIFTRESLIGMLERLGVNTRDQASKLQTKNVAAVMVTAELPAFARSGGRVDVAISALGDATNLTGGTLLVTPLLAADGEVYAVAQGALATGAIAAKGGASSVTRGVPTSGRIANGATVEREIAFRLDKNNGIRLGLRNPDLTTARRIETAINNVLGPVAKAIDPHTVALQLGGRDPIDALAAVEDLRILPDNAAIVVIEESSGTIVMGDNVRISTRGDRAGQPDDTGDRDATGQSAGTTVERNHCGRAAHGDPGGRSARQEAGHPAGQRDVARPGGEPERTRGGAARPDQHPAIDQGCGRPASRSGDEMSGHILPAAAPPVPAGSTLPPEQVAKIWKGAQNFEAMALGELLKPMFDTVDTSKSAFGGGSAEGQWRPLMIDAIGKQMAARGGLGLAEPAFKAMLRAQEHKS